MASVLVVDDKLIMRRKIKGELRKLGLTISGEAKNGKMALVKCQENEPDLIMLDILMPGMDGIETLKKIRKEFPDVKVVMVTSLSKKDKVLKAIKSGADHYIVKPIKEQNIRGAVTETLGENVINESSTG